MNSLARGFISLQFDPNRVADRIWHRLSGFYDFLIFSSLLLCFECVAMAFVSCLIQEVRWSMTIAVIPFLAAFSIYNLNRKTDEDEDAINRVDRYAFTKRYERPLYYGAVLTMVLCLVVSGTSGMVSLLVTLTPFLLGILYSFRLLPKRCGYQRLKEIPGVKNIIVGISWGIPLAFLPVLLNQGMPDFQTAIAFVLFFLWGFLASMIPDIRDREGDARAGVRTIPVMYGEEKTRSILTAVLLLLGIPLIISSLFCQPVFTTLLLLAANAYSHGCVHLSGWPAIRNVVADALSDGQYIILVLAMTLCAPLLSLF